MKITFFDEVNKIWSKFGGNTTDAELKFSLDVHKKLLSFFQVGDYYYYVFNVSQSSFELISNDITPVLGYHPEEMDIALFVNNIHPEDQPWFLNFENKVSEFFSTLSCKQIPNYKVRYDFRVRKKDGEYIRIQHQVVTIQLDEDNRILRTFGVHTDISHIKQHGLPVLSFIGLNGEPSYIGVNVAEVFSPVTISLTPREREVLALLIEGKKSEEIRKLLFISKQTVDSHRKNLLKKTKCLNTAALTSMAIKKGWV
jgi:DNA-binding CsgD family transcriptional regulator